MINILLTTLFTNEWKYVNPDSCPQNPQTFGEKAKYYWLGIKWKLRHPVQSLSHKDGAERKWVAKLRSLGTLFTRPM